MWKRDLRTWNRLSSVSILKQDLGPESLKKRAKFLLSQVEMVFKTKQEAFIWFLRCFSNFFVLTLQIKQMESERDRSFLYPS